MSFENPTPNPEPDQPETPKEETNNDLEKGSGETPSNQTETPSEGTDPDPENGSKETLRDDDETISRREATKRILRGLGAAAGINALLVAALNRTSPDTPPSKSDNEIDSGNAKPEKKPDKQPPEEKTEELAEIESLEMLIDPDSEEDIELTPEAMRAVTNYWKQCYSDEKNPELRDSLYQAYEKMQPWLNHLSEVFYQNGVPKHFLYLAIPESHWQLEANSRTGAVGPYQFMPKTANTWELKMEENIDERQDSVRSADACARLLKYLYERTEDWDLALSGYNGSFIWDYLRETKEEYSYENFLKHISKEINREKKKVQEKASHIVQESENINSIAKDWRCSVEELCRINNIENPDLIKVGQKIRAPLTPSLKKEFWSSIRGYLENLNYPPKFTAVWELIQEGKVEHLVNDPVLPIEFDIKPAGQGSARHTFDPEEDENLFNLAKRFEISLAELKQANPHLEPTELRGGEEIATPDQQASLQQVAEKEKVELATLEYLNPAILDSDKPLPPDYQVRIPKDTVWV